MLPLALASWMASCDGRPDRSAPTQKDSIPSVKADIRWPDPALFSDTLVGDPVHLYLLENGKGMRAILTNYGARMVGGGFGGCAIVLCKPDVVATLSRTLRDMYRAKFSRDCTITRVETAAGGRIIAR